ncbi:MAG TPA: sterol desaturase family protein [Saprospiraceae bacterium]|nr:sterol desaturase family protein [Saprospiraceae bacterium]MCB9271676.1 sterol desaturase family protein [Lewinellaceae bacterium]HPG09017.1 sterol desaturase family protein [Saprospiraceae bacterium]HPQ98901.1 sterol desaturase family protein [Saprospiraceae bacterium]HQU53441.1 sterol desaturase family protein [Saprospiraceae bacterium]
MNQTPNDTAGAQGQIFQNPALEFFSKSPPRVSAAIYALIILGFLALSWKLGKMVQPGIAALWYLGAFVFWTFFEYFAHRYFFHLDHYFPKSKLAARISYIFHGIHHDYPRDVSRIIMPPAPGLLIIATLYLIGLLILGANVYLFLAGFLTGYLFYTYIHYKTHTTPVPGYLKAQYRHHALHHYKYPEKAFGVSSMFWDRVFGTMPPKKAGK